MFCSKSCGIELVHVVKYKMMSINPIHIISGGHSLFACDMKTDCHRVHYLGSIQQELSFCVGTDYFFIIFTVNSRAKMEC